MQADGEPAVRDEDLYALIRMSSEVGQLGGDLTARRLHALNGLVALCNADKGVVVEFNRHKRTGSWELVADSAQFVNTPDLERRRLARFYRSNEPVDPVIERIAQVSGPVVVARPSDLLAERVWRGCPHYLNVRKPSNIAEQIYAQSRIGDMACGIGLHRRDARPFGNREVRLVEAFMSGAGSSLHGSRTTKPAHIIPVLATPSLPPRLASVLARFLLGESEKEAAHHLGVTHHTVHSYAKQLYRRLGVTSRSELLARFIQPPKALHSGPRDRSFEQ